MIKIKRRDAEIILFCFLTVLFIPGLACAQPTPKQADAALASAVTAKNITLVRHLLSHGANANATYVQGMTPLMLAADNEDVATAALLLSHGSLVDSRDFNGQTALHHAALYGLSSYDENDFVSQGDVSKRYAIFSMMRLLITHHANVNAMAKNGRTPLMLTAWFAQSPRCVRLLLEHRANVKARDNDGWSTLQWASFHGSDAGVIALLRHYLNQN